MNKPANNLVDSLIVRSLALQRVANSLMDEASRSLRVVIREVVKLVSDFGIASRETLIGSVEYLIRSHFESLTRTLENRLSETISEQIVLELNLWKQRGVNLNTPTVEIRNVILMGASFQSWMKRISGSVQFLISRIIRESDTRDESVDALIVQIRGTRSAGYRDSVIDQTLIQLDGLIRTTLDRYQTDVRENLALVNPSKQFHLQQISILDSRTTPICTDYAFSRWDHEKNPIGHRRPYHGGTPRHWNCRSIIVLLLPDDESYPEKNLREWIEERPHGEVDKLFGQKRVNLWMKNKLTTSELIR